MRILLLYIFTVSLAFSQPYQINPVNMTRSRTREAWITVNSNTTYFSANLGGGTEQTNISYTAVTNTLDFALPSDGIYVFGFTNSATVSLASQLHISAMLQLHNN